MSSITHPGGAAARGRAKPCLMPEPRRPLVATRPGQQVVRASASVCVPGQRGESPLQVDALRPVTEGNCVAARRGGKQPEVNDQSATQVNSIRPARAASLLANGEAQTGANRMSPTLRGSVSKRWESRGGGWRRNGRKARHMKQRDLHGPDGRSRSLRSEEPAMQESEEP
jgi:hypothetical protein